MELFCFCRQAGKYVQDFAMDGQARSLSSSFYITEKMQPISGPVSPVLTITVQLYVRSDGQLSFAVVQPFHASGPSTFLDLFGKHQFVV